MSDAVLNPDGAASPMPALSAKVLRHWLRGWTTGRVVVEWPRGRRLAFGTGGPEVSVTIHSARALLRLAAAGSLGWAQGYIAGEWDTPDLSAFLAAAARNLGGLRRDSGDGPWLARVFHRALHALRANTKAGSRRNIAAHYDLGNGFYRLWLDSGMTYSSAIFEHRAETLESAQQRKYRRLCDILALQPSDHVLEIGCGWGGFAEVAARDYGCRVTALTVSEQQAAFARDDIDRRGLSSQVDIRLQDYRDLDSAYSAVVSIEMFEAVGEKNWPVYFDTLRRCLAPGGRAAIQTITIDHAKFADYRRSADFIQRYVFPGGMLPSPAAFREQAAAAGFGVAGEYFFGSHYAQTLRRWADAFNGAWPAIAALGFDTRFRRLWNYYLSDCEAGFTTGHLDVGQFLLVRGGGPPA